MLHAGHELQTEPQQQNGPLARASSRGRDTASPFLLTSLPTCWPYARKPLSMGFLLEKMKGRARSPPIPILASIWSLIALLVLRHLAHQTNGI